VEIAEVFFGARQAKENPLEGLLATFFLLVVYPFDCQILVWPRRLMIPCGGWLCVIA